MEIMDSNECSGFENPQIRVTSLVKLPATAIVMIVIEKRIQSSYRCLFAVFIDIFLHVFNC